MSTHHDYDALPNNVDAPSFRQELRVVASVVIFMILLEIIARVIAPDLDYDRKNIHEFPETISKLEERAEKAKTQRIVFFGNSLMLHGLSEEIFHRESDLIGAPKTESCKVTPVGTAMLDWVYLYRRYFAEQKKNPDYLVVGFVRHHIYDQEPIKLRRLSRHFVSDRDLPRLWKKDLWKNKLSSFHDVVQSTLCHFSALEGDQPEHRLGLLYMIVPEYQAGVKINNRLVEADKKRKAKAKAIREGKPMGEPVSTYQRMERFITYAKSHHVKLIFVPMPQPEVWDFDPKAVELIKKEGQIILDARQIKGMTPEDFYDGYHLGDTGKERFSKWLAREMKRVIE